MIDLTQCWIVSRFPASLFLLESSFSLKFPVPAKLVLAALSWRPRHIRVIGPSPQTERHRTAFSAKHRICRLYSGFGIKSKLLGTIPPTRMEGGQGAVSGGASSPTTSARPGTGGSYKRKRSGAEFESSPGSGGEDNEEEGERRRQPGVKRACNECRQQKVSHEASRQSH